MKNIKYILIWVVIFKCLYLIVFLFSSCHCTKPLEEPKCIQAYLFSDKYTIDTVFKKTDTLWKENCLSLKWYNILKNEKAHWLRLCPPGELEYWYYTFRKN